MWDTIDNEKRLSLISTFLDVINILSIPLSRNVKSLFSRCYKHLKYSFWNKIVNATLLDAKIYQVFLLGWNCNVNFTRWYKHLQNFWDKIVNATLLDAKIYQVFLLGWNCNVNFTRWYKHLQNFWDKL